MGKTQTLKGISLTVLQALIKYLFQMRFPLHSNQFLGQTLSECI